jgi:hypothetical protein
MAYTERTLKRAMEDGMTRDVRKEAAKELDDAQMDALQGGGREDQIQVIAINYAIKSPRDAASGQATGKRRHKPLTI